MDSSSAASNPGDSAEVNLPLEQRPTYRLRCRVLFGLRCTHRFLGALGQLRLFWDRGIRGARLLQSRLDRDQPPIQVGTKLGNHLWTLVRRFFGYLGARLGQIVLVLLGCFLDTTVQNDTKALERESRYLGKSKRKLARGLRTGVGQVAGHGARTENWLRRARTG